MLKSSRCTEMAIIWYGIGGEWSKKWKWRMVMFAEQEAIWLSSDIRQQFRGVCFQVWDRSLSPPSAKQKFGIIFLVKIRLLGYQPIDAPSYPSSANQNFSWVHRWAVTLPSDLRVPSNHTFSESPWCQLSIFGRNFKYRDKYKDKYRDKYKDRDK